jgi:Peptidase family M1 domain
MQLKCPLWPLFGLLLTVLPAPALAAPPDGPAQPPGQTRRLAPPPEWLPHYDLDIRLDIAGHAAHVKQRVTWTNRSTIPVNEIVFNAHSHYVVPQKDVGLLAKTLEILRMNPDEGIYTQKPPFDLSRAVAGGQESRFHFVGDTDTDLVVPLAGPLAPGQAVTVELDYILHLPQKQGRWGQWEGVTFMSNWLPVVAVHDDKGWQPTPFVPWHQPFFNEAGLYTAHVVLPADQKIACSGTITGRRNLPDGQQQVDITANAVRDFAFLCSNRFVEFTGEAQTAPGMPAVRLHCFAFPEHEYYARFMLQTVAEAMDFYSRCIGPYPWSDFTVVESFFGWNGNECGTLVMIDERVFGMPHVGEGYVEYLVSHETCHQWWYNLIGTNGWCETWMDEAMATYFAHKFLDHKYGHNNKMLRYPRGLEWLPNIPRDSYRYYTMYGVIGRGEQGPIVQEMPKFGHIANLFGMCYDKGSRVVGMIEDRLGPDGFLAFTHRLHDRYRYRIIRVADVQRELEEFTHQSWDEFFKRWLYGSGLCDWAVEKVKIEPVNVHDQADGSCKVTVLLHQKGDYDEATTLGFCLDACGKKDEERLPYQVRIPIIPQAQVVEQEDLHARVETLPDHRVRVEVVLPCRPVQIAVDPDQVLVDRDPTNNYWKTPIRWRFSPVFTMLDEADLTTAYDCWNLTFGPWLYGSAYNDAWYERATIIGGRLGAYRTQQFSGGVYAGYRTTFRDFVVGADGLWDHLPWDRTQIGFNVEQRVGSLSDYDVQPNREVLFARYVFQYNSSLYLPPIHFLETFLTRQDNFLPVSRTFVPGQQRYQDETLTGLHYHLDYLTPYWDPQGGMALDLAYAGGNVKLDKSDFANQVTGQFSTVKSLPDLSGHLDEETWPGKMAEPVLRWLGDTRLAARVFGAGGWPNQGQYFALGGDTMFRGFDQREREGSTVWLASLEWRVPILRHTHYDACDHILSLNNVYGAVFADAGDAYTNGHSAGPVAYDAGLGLRFDVTWFGFVERTTLRFDVAKAINVDTPVEFWFGANMPF